MLYNGRMVFEDMPDAADDRREAYLLGINEYIERRRLEGREMRMARVLSTDFLSNIEAYRKMYREMLGLDTLLEESVPLGDKEYVGSDDLCDIYRLRVFITPEIPMYALLFLPKVGDRVPLFIAQHGGGGSPELCSDLVGKNNYNHMVQRLLSRGAAVIAPQLLLWSEEETETFRAHPISYSRQEQDKKLKHIGVSITALEIAGIIRFIDYGCTLPAVDPDKIGMIGASYGGYFTLHTMAADTRIKVGCVSAVFNDRDVYDWMDWCYRGSAFLFHDAEVAALCAPRRLWVSVGREDRVFDHRTAEPEGERMLGYFAALGCSDSVRFSVWDGGHTVEESDGCYDFMFEALESKGE